MPAHQKPTEFFGKALKASSDATPVPEPIHPTPHPGEHSIDLLCDVLGGTASTAMTHIAVLEQLDGKTVQWMEPVSDDQYRRAGSATGK